MLKILYIIWRIHTLCSEKKKWVDSLWQDENLNYEDAEEDQAGTGDVILESRQGRCSVLWKRNMKLLRHPNQNLKSCMRKFAIYMHKNYRPITHSYALHKTFLCSILALIAISIPLHTIKTFHFYYHHILEALRHLWSIHN